MFEYILQRSIQTGPFTPGAEAEKDPGPYQVRPIARQVVKNQELIRTEAELEKLKARVGVLGEEIREKSASLRFESKIDPFLEQEVAALDADRRRLNEEYQTLRSRVSSLRFEYGAEVCEALKAVSRPAARAAYEAALSLRDSLQLLDKVNGEVRRAGGEGFFVPPISLDLVLERMKALSQ